MNLVNLKVEVHCERAPWADPGVNPKFSLVRYRFFVDNDLIIERDWGWTDAHHYLREIIWAELDQGTHTVKIEPVLLTPNQAKFTLRNLLVNDQHLGFDDNTELAFEINT